jgi:hypothetical protein
VTVPEQDAVEVPETEREPAPVVGVDVPVELPTLADGSPFPVPEVED